MGDALVFGVLQKIAAVIAVEVAKAGSSTLLKEACDQRNIRNTIMHIQTEFMVMQAFLRRANVHTAKNETFEAWLEEVQKVANKIEDIIDEYVYLIGKIEGTSNYLKKRIRYMKNCISLHEIHTQLKEVKDHLGHLTEMRDRYGISISDLERSSNNPPNSCSRMDISAYTNAIVEAEVVGNKEERAKLFQWLLEEELGRAIISVFGMGGVGKTTLVNTIYRKEEIKKNFDCCAFVSVSQSFQVEDLIRSISKQILEKEEKLQTGIDHIDPRDLIDRLQQYMQNKSYLIVLDDMWKRDAWLSLSHALPVNNCRGRVVTTTRIKDVALLADENRAIELRPLSEGESWDLFCTKAFGKLREKICPPYLVAWAKKILEKCQGLPLAIVAIGSLLSYRERVETEWRMFYDQLSWVLSSNSELGWVADVLNLSYDNLPTYLKKCFLYCSLFPEDFVIRKKMIIRLWIAEGFVEQKGRETTFEEVAGTYLVELADRSLLQVVERDVNGRAKRYRMHDLVRDICIARSKKEMFGIVYDNQYLTDLKGNPRRVTIQNQCEYLQLDGGSSKLRSFLLFNNQLASSQIETSLSNFKLIRVLSLKYSNMVNLPDVVYELFNLHYLDLSYTKINVISKSLGRLKLLQTLDLRFTLVEQLPREITKLTNLRHLLVYVCHDYTLMIYDWRSGVPVPVEICGLKDLQTLNAIEANQKLVFQLRSLSMLRSLDLLKVKGSYISDLWFSLLKMPRLTDLGIVACNKDEVLNFADFNPLPSLEKLSIQGKLEGRVIPSIFSRFGNIRDLRMGWSGLRADPLSSFLHMYNLTDLSLFRAYEGQVLTFCSGWFPKLKTLALINLSDLSRINFEDGTTQSLYRLKLIGLRRLIKLSEGIRYLSELHDMVIRDMPVEFVENLRGDGQAIVRHVAAVKIYD
ncbi:hypothetical protein LUZ60_008660 [Juncus effusus]|nr:hypothetical protein LUZ60_008660 [Juncus effusus]